MGSPLFSDSEWLSSGIWVPSHSLDIASMLGLTFILLPRNLSHLRAILLPIPEDAATSRGSFEAEKLLSASSGYLHIHILQHTDEGSHPPLRANSTVSGKLRCKGSFVLPIQQLSTVRFCAGKRFIHSYLLHWPCLEAEPDLSDPRAFDLHPKCKLAQISHKCSKVYSLQEALKVSIPTPHLFC